MAFNARLRELREAANLSQAELAERAGLSKGGIADLEQNRNRPTWDSVQKLAVALGVSCEAFNEPAESDEKRERGRPRKAAPDAATGPAAATETKAAGKRKRKKGGA
jgi:transcriptional regulator with XRE-family HTH domain